MAEHSDLERTGLPLQQPLQRRLDQAREKCQVARSRELSTITVLLVGGATLCFMGESLSRHLMESLHVWLALDKGLACNSRVINNPISLNST
jgi:flagellar biosynthetic protein FlhB